MPVSERTVSLINLEPNQARDVLQSQGMGGGTKLTDLTKSIPKFTKLSYPAFNAEYALEGDNIVIHFFVPGPGIKITEEYWTSLFADGLNAVGQDHFQATKPRLVARYTEELKSWWFKAQGYSHIIDVPRYVTRFFEKLDAHMAPALQTQSRRV